MAARILAARTSTSGPAPATLALRFLTVAGCALAVANCASNTPRRVASGPQVDPRYGVKPSPRVVADGQPVPKGGGRYMVGKPYTIGGRTYVPNEKRSALKGVGTASWYGEAFHGRLTANGEIFDREALMAAHPTMPLPSYARVTNTRNGRSMIVRVNDRGPYHADRVIDVSERAADALDFRRGGVAQVRVDYVGRASLDGSDDRKLIATLTQAGPASLAPSPAGAPAIPPTMMASARPAAPTPTTPAPLAHRSAEPVEAEEEEAETVAMAPPTPKTRPTTLAAVAPEPDDEEPEETAPRPPSRPAGLAAGAPSGAALAFAPAAPRRNPTAMAGLE